MTTPSQPLGTPVYPTHFWEPGRPVRTRPVFDLPGGLSTGRYEIRLLLAETGKQETLVSVPLGSLALDERPRRFQLPSIGVATDGEWHDGVRLARVVMPESARAGSELLLTLIWRASGVPDRNWKVFIHLVDAAGHVKAQGDAFPLNNGDGPAPTSSWREGEVILDEHRISLPPDLPAGGYTLLVGLYIEESSERLALSTGKDAFELPVKLDVFAP